MSETGLSQAILDSVSEGVFTVDTHWKISSFNRAAEEITGVLRKEALGQRCSDVLHATLCETRCPIRHALRNRALVADQRCYFVNIEGERIPIRVSATALIGDRGEVLGGVETFRDLRELDALRSALHGQATGTASTSQNRAMRSVLERVALLAGNSTNVMIYGETGSGKEVIAHAIHDQGARANRPFIAINCGALPENLLESELFGYKKGAFTGADRDRPGRFSLVGDGTLFFDEIGEISQAMQIRLLRVLEAREFDPLGSTHAEPLKARIIAASHRDLKAMVDSGQFREDLYYRLVVMRLDIPPLRERREDIPALVMVLLNRTRLHSEHRVSDISPEAMAVLKNQDWPGNIRQLANTIECAAMLCRGELIGPEHLPSEWCASLAPVAPFPAQTAAATIRRAAEARLILATLRENHFSRQQTAAQLGMHPSTLYRKIRNWKLLPDQNDSPANSQT